MKLEQIVLTADQRAKLQPYFDAVKKGNADGHRTAIVGQVWTDGIVIKFLQGEKADALATALGGDMTRIHSSASERMRADSI
jgi:hypothetical protein